MRRKFSIRDFGAGAIVGVLLGTSGLATAALGYERWQTLSQDFKIGYVSGYLEMSNIARNLEPGGYVDQKYPQAQAKPVMWAAMVDQLYRDPEYQRYSINSVMQAVAVKLKEKYGAQDPVERSRDRMAIQMQAIQKQKAAQAKAEAEGKAPPKIKHIEQPTKQVATPAKKPARKWCRCDGKDPKAERARRRAARAEAEKAEKAKAAGSGEQAPADSRKTQPEAGKPATAPPAPAKP